MAWGGNLVGWEVRWLASLVGWCMSGLQSVLANQALGASPSRIGDGAQPW